MNAVLVFPGQGSQRPGMLDTIPEVDALDRLLDAAEALVGLDLRRIAQDGDATELTDTRAAQPLLYLADWAWGSVLLDVGIEPAAVAGHSLGEFAALAIAGAFSVEAGLELVCERSRLMSEAAAASPGRMSAVLGLDRSACDEVVDGVDGVWVANDNAPGQLVISGRPDAVDQAGDLLLQAGARRVVPLAVSGAFHSPLMRDACARFADVLAAADVRDSHVPVLQNARPEPATDARTLRDALASQIESPVRWTETMRNTLAYEPVTLIETGPGTVLKGLARRIPGLAAVAVEETGVQTLVEEVLR